MCTSPLWYLYASGVGAQATQLRQGGGARPSLAEVQAVSKLLAQLEVQEEQRMGTTRGGRQQVGE